MRHLLTYEHWEAIFKELMDRDLIDLPDSYYYEKPFFDNPDELTERFDQIEATDLMCIMRTQEA